MAIEQKSIHLFITKDFNHIYEEFVNLIADDPGFIEILKERKEKDKRIKARNIESMKIRFAISDFIIKNKARILQHKLSKLKGTTTLAEQESEDESLED